MTSPHRPNPLPIDNRQSTIDNSTMTDSHGHSGAYRILDANINRAREALRVMEDYARFVLEDGDLTQALKESRHALADCVRCLEAAPGTAPLFAARDILGDVGREITTASEGSRDSTADVVIAAGKRVSEALRSIEEYGKTITCEFAAAVEKLRYRGYEIERRLAMTIRAREFFGQVRLYVIITEGLCRRGWFETAEAALRGGADVLQLREKSISDAELLTRAKRLVALCREHGALFVVNDRTDIAAVSGAHGVHLGQQDLPVAAARRILPPPCLVGVSTHTLEQVRAAARQASDYIAVGPMFDSPTKPQARIAGPVTLAEARRITALPLVAIGGITRANAPAVVSAATCCLCVCQDVIAQADAEAAARILRETLDRFSGNPDKPR
jgi:thiamine-phosphate pyrophosphorylase